MATGKIFTVYEKPEAPEPTARVALVREGFSIWAFIFNIPWLLFNRLWVAAVIYILLLGIFMQILPMLGMHKITVMLLQLFMQFGLGLFAHDLQRHALTRRGYRFAGVIAADSDVKAEQRYYEHVA